MATNALRYSVLRQQPELIKAQKEATSFYVAEIRLALGARTAQSITFHRDLERLEGLVNSNFLVSSHLSATQKSFNEFGKAAQTFLASLIRSTAGTLVTRSPRRLHAVQSISAAAMDRFMTTVVEPISSTQSGRPISRTPPTRASPAASRSTRPPKLMSTPTKSASTRLP